MYRRHRIYILILVLLTAVGAGTSLAADNAAAVTAAKARFKPGEAAPAGWTLSGGKGRRVEGRILEVTGNGTDSSIWRHDYPFVPGGVYRFQVHARRTSGSGGCAVAGASFANTDHGFSEEWRWYGSVFRAPENVERDAFLRIGQWNASGALQFDGVRIVPVLPVYTAVGRLRLGNGEAIRRGRYSFSNESVEESGNCHRPLLSATVGYNTDRWGFGGDGQVVYRFHLPGHAFRNGTVEFTINYHTQGGCVADVSRDGQAWRKLGGRDSEGEVSAPLPADLLPAETVYLRLRTANAGSSFQVNHVGFSGDLSGNPPDVVGRTAYADMEGKRGQSPDAKGDSPLVIEEISCDDSSEPARPVIRLTAGNRGSAACEAALSVRVAGQPADAGQRQAARLAPGQSHTFTAAVPLMGVGVHQIRLSLAAAAGQAVTASLVVARARVFSRRLRPADWGDFRRGGPVVVRGGVEDRPAASRAVQGLGGGFALRRPERSRGGANRRSATEAAQAAYGGGQLRCEAPAGRRSRPKTSRYCGSIIITSTRLRIGPAWWPTGPTPCRP